MSIQSNLKGLREKSGMSLTQAAQKMGTSKSNLSKMENNEDMVLTINSLMKASAAYDVPLAKILDIPFISKQNLGIATEVIEFIPTLISFMEKYPNARDKEELKNHPLGKVLKDEIVPYISKGTGLDMTKYTITPSMGKGRFAEVPWICVFDDEISKSATKGYYVVLLFSPAGNEVFISLNQGVTFFEQRYNKKGLPGNYIEKLQKVAEFWKDKLKFSNERISKSPIHLKGSGKLAKGYEAGHIAGASLTINDLQKVNSKEVFEVILELLGGLMQIKPQLSLYGGFDGMNASILLEDDQLYLDEFEEELEKEQQVIEKISKEQKEYNFDELVLEPGADALPPIEQNKGKKQYPRSASEAAKALQRANHTCEVDSTHTTFISAVTGEMFMELHHIIPLHVQHKFEKSLDTFSNIACLCSTDHRLLHHGLFEEKVGILRKLYEDRVEEWKVKGIYIEFDELLTYYK
ncbi:MrcB family domain-containing protein [Solibacillus daqui]|uniref:MrcB family domain-containing protein n=1 Tax=Solibacillus daqui TaxID=2912187 RepID=UPI0023655139|nr:DUF3578 domain-containing protein [Solibacillus daqui]